MVKKLLLSAIMTLVISAQAFAGGFQINEHGARAMAMAGAFTGLANDPSAIYFNPAGLTQLSGTHLLLGSTIISPKASFRGPAPQVTEYSLQSQTFTPINFYFTHQLSNKFVVGVSVNNPYGLGTKWDKDWVGKYLAVDTELRSFFVTAVFSYKLTDALSIAVGPIYAFGDVRIERYNGLAPFSGDVYFKMKGDGTAWGLTGGIFYKPDETFSVGISYRSQVKFDFSGTATAEGAPKAMVDAGLIPGGDITASLTTPRNVTFGMAFMPTKKLTVSGDLQYVGWSSYDVLAVDFKDSKYTDLEAPRHYGDTFIHRLGVEYNATDAVDLRGGVLYDMNPVKDGLVDPSLPDSDRWGFNIGLGLNLTKHLKFDLAYMFLRFDERTIKNSQISYTGGESPFNGTYNSSAHLFGVNVSYQF